MVEVRVVKPMWRTKSKKKNRTLFFPIFPHYFVAKIKFFSSSTESDLIPGFGTFVACLVLKLEFGILLGIMIQILFLLYNAARPKIHMQKITVIFSYFLCYRGRNILMKYEFSGTDKIRH